MQKSSDTLLRKAISLFVCFFYFLSTDSQNFQWVKALKGKNQELINSVCTDNAGNIFVTGYFNDSTDFDPGPNPYLFYPLQYDDAFIEKLDPNGNLIWIEQFAGWNVEQGTTVKTNSVGDLYATGWLSGVDLDPGPNPYYIWSPGIVVLKLDGNGNFLFAKNFAAGGLPRDLHLDNMGNVYVVGGYSGDNDFDPGPGTFTMTSNINGHIFITKYDTDCNLKWAKNIGGGYNLVDVYSVVTDPVGNVFVTGVFLNTIDFDPGPATYTLLSNSASYDNFVLKLDSSGNFVWVQQIGGPLHEDKSKLCVDQNGDITVTGIFKNTVDFDPSSSTFSLTSQGDFDVYLLKLNANGNFVWAKSFGGITQDVSNEIKNNTIGEIFVTGYFQDTVDFDPGIGTYTISSRGATDSYVSKFDPQGNFSWTRTVAGAGWEYNEKIAVDIFSNVILCGGYQDTAHFQTTYITESSPPWGDTYITKLGTTITTDLISRPNGLCSAYPNPSNGNFKIDFSKNCSAVLVTISDLMGRTVSKMGYANTNSLHIKLDVAPGIYLATINADEISSNIKIIVVD